MNSAELVQAGRLEEGLSALQTEIRDKPEDTRLRIFLFQLDCVLGRLDKALTQLQVIADLNADTMLLAQIFRPVIACELLRREVFAGKRTPIIFGEPAEWLGLLIHANELVARGEFAAAAESRGKAFDAAPASAGKINGEPFEWIADSDSRLGPVLEAIIDGKYYWVPFCRIQKITPRIRVICGTWSGFRRSSPGPMVGQRPAIFPRAMRVPRSRRTIPCGSRARRIGSNGRAKPTLVWGSVCWPPTPMSIPCWDAAVSS